MNASLSIVILLANISVALWSIAFRLGDINTKLHSILDKLYDLEERK